MMSIFSPFDAFCAESSGWKLFNFSRRPSSSASNSAAQFDRKSSPPSSSAVNVDRDHENSSRREIANLVMKKDTENSNKIDDRSCQKPMTVTKKRNPSPFDAFSAESNGWKLFNFSSCSSSATQFDRRSSAPPSSSASVDRNHEDCLRRESVTAVKKDAENSNKKIDDRSCRQPMKVTKKKNPRIMDPVPSFRDLTPDPVAASSRISEQSRSQFSQARVWTRLIQTGSCSETRKLFNFSSSTTKFDRKIDNSYSKRENPSKIDDQSGRQQRANSMMKKKTSPRFAVELDGVYCFETVLPY
ncbi:hypothetical protein Cgig2_019312 [Carnegiea gigantea]|uniref:Uncharacterized protein n=1 Tax=Carnegiea gigantea TaxID=171969 RepID=A0A9Q1KMT9_9CARY|nr:hypothetical protein Cgig2_019312 [Carnegiea gigantea]